MGAAACALLMPYWEWNALGSSKAAKAEYLRAALRGACSESLAINSTNLTTLNLAQSGTSAPSGLRASAAAFTPGEKAHKRC